VRKSVGPAVLVLVVGLAVGGCGRVKPSGPSPTSNPSRPTITIDFTGQYHGPARAPAGARAGGTITVLKEAGFEHLCPQQIYVADALAHGQLIHRTLTGYIEEPRGGGIKLVGDLATNAGETTDNGRTWKYTLRDDIAFEDGTPITSKQVALGLARSFGALGQHGPQYFQTIVDPQRRYTGPTDANPLPPGVTTPDPKTIILTLPGPHVEIPFLMSFPTSTPMKSATDTPENCDAKPFSTGPYQVKEYQKDVKLVLARNPHWVASSDPIRTQYPDMFSFEFGPNPVAQTNRLTNPTGADRSAVMDTDVAAELISGVKADPSLVSRVSSGATPFVAYAFINTRRVKDVNVRKALNYAFDRDAYIKAVGGYDVAQPATTLLAPVVPGYKQFDVYRPANGGANGDPARARALLAGQKPKLIYCFPNTQLDQTVAATVTAGWGRAGFEFVLTPIDAGTYFTTVGAKGVECDLILGGWAQDWPDPESTLGALFDGSKIVDEGNVNFSYFDDPGVTRALADLRRVTDRASVAARYGDLDEMIMRDFAPAVPLRYIRNYTLAGPDVGNTWLSPMWARHSLVMAYVKA